MSDSSDSVSVGGINAHLALDDQLSGPIEVAAQKFNKSADGMSGSAKTLEERLHGIEKAIDPVAAKAAKLSSVHADLKAGLDKGILSQDKYNTLLGEAEKKFGHASHEGASFHSVIEGLSTFLRAGGGEAAEYGEKIEGLTHRFSGLASVATELGPLALVVGAVAIAVGGLVVAFEGFEILKEIVSEGMKTQVVYDQLEATLKATGSSANISSHEIIESAGALALLSGRSKESVVQADNVLARFSRIGEEAFPRASKAVLDYAQQTGKALPESATLIGKVLQGSTMGLRALQEVGVVFTADQKKALTQLVETGQIAKYQEIIFNSLSHAIDGSAEAYGNTLAGSVGKAKFVLGEFKEAVASEIIPALELLTNDLIDSLGGWDKVTETVIDWGHNVGDAVRTTVIGAIIAYHQWRLETLDLEIAIAEGLGSISGSFLSTAANIAQSLSHLPSIIGGGMAQAQAASQLRDLKKASDITFGAIKASAQESAQAQVVALANATTALASHKQALEGTDKVYDHHKDVLDGLKKVNEELEHKIDALTEKYRIAADNAKLKADAEAAGGNVLRQVIEQNTIHAKVTEAVNSLDKISAERKAELIDILTRYATAEQESNNQGEKNKEILSAQISVAQDYAAGQIKIEESLIGSTAATRLQSAATEAYWRAFSKGFETDKKYIADLTLLILKRKEDAKAVDIRLSQIKRDLDISVKLRTAQADFTDALTGTKDASRDLTAQLELENIVRERGGELIGDELSDIEDLIKADHDRVNSLGDLSKAAKSLKDVFNEADFQIAVQGISTTDSNLHQIQEQWLSLLRTMGDGSIAAGQKVFDKLKVSAEDVKAAFQTIADAATVKSISGAGKSTFQLYKEERDNIERVVREKTGIVVDIEKDGAAKLIELSTQFWDKELGNWGDALGFLSEHFGGFFGSLHDLATGIQSALKFGQSVQSAASGISGLSSVAGAIGGIATVVGIFAVVYDFVDKMIKKAKSVQYGNGTDFNMVGGQIGVTALDANAIKVVNAIHNAVISLGNALGGAVTDITDIGIRIRNDGKYVAAYVHGVMIGHFESVDDAIKAALQEALSEGAVGFRGLTDLVKQGLSQWTAPNMDEELAFLQKLKEIGDLASSSSGSVNDAFNHFMDLFDALSQVSKITPAVTQGFEDIGLGIDRVMQNWSDSITGRVQTPEELLFDKQREGELFNARRALYIAELAMKKSELQGEYEVLKARGHLIGGGGGGGGGGASGGSPRDSGSAGGDGGILGAYAYELAGMANFVHARGVLLSADLNIGGQYISARGQLVVAEDSLYQQQLDALLAQINAIGQIIDNLPGEIDIPSIRLPNTGSGTGSNRAQDLASFRQQLADIVASGLPSAQQGFRDLQNRIQDLTARARELHTPISQLGPAFAELTRQYQQGLRAQANTLAGIGTDFTARLSDGIQFFQSLAALGRVKTGIPDWLREVLEGRFLDRMRADWQSKVDDFRGLTNPMLEIQSRANDLRTDLAALAAATHMSADQINAAQQQINEGVAFQRQSAINSILDKLYGYVKGSAEWSAKALEFEKLKVDLDFRLMQAQLVALNAWDDATANLLNAAHQAAIDQINAGDAISGASSDLSSASSSLQSVVDLQKEVMDKWKSDMEGLKQYQTSLRTDASIGMVNPRQALDNSQQIYESLRAQSLLGDETALAKLKDAAETYSHNLSDFSPSSELLSGLLQGIDQTITQLGAVTPQVQFQNAQIQGLTNINTSIGNWTTTYIPFAQHTADTETSTHVTLLHQADFIEHTSNNSDKTVTLTQDLKEAVIGLTALIATWRAEYRDNNGQTMDKDDQLTSTLQKMSAWLDRNGAQVNQLGGTR